MPELPELQAHAERLEAAYAGRALAAFRPLSFTALKTYDPPPEAAAGHRLDHVGRRGKYLLVGFDPLTFVVHLMQGGRLKPDEKQSAKPRGGLARWVFDDGSALLLTEAGTEKRAGVWVVDGDPTTQPPLDDLGPEADQVSPAELAAILGDRRGRLHGLLRDQGAVAGLGRRLANEVCHRARLSPFANTAGLDEEEVGRLHQAIGETVAESLEYERGRDEMSRSADRPGAVHHREGEDCPVCGDEVRAVSYRSYTVNYCPTCQTEGRTLADRTTSRFLK